MNKLKTVLLFCIPVAIFAAFSPAGKGHKPDILQANLDNSVDPGKDFYLYGNGGWLKNNPIPATESRWGIGNLVKDEIYVQLKKISEDAAYHTHPAKNTAEQRIGDLYSSAMDSASIDRAGISGIKLELNDIESIQTLPELVDMIARLQTYSVSPAFGMGVAQDEKNSSVMAMHFSQGGLGLPNRDYYFNTDSRTKKIRDAYVKYISETLLHISNGPAMAKDGADGVMALETALAKASRKLEDLRDPYANYNKMPVAVLDKLTPSIRWEDVFKNWVSQPRTV